VLTFALLSWLAAAQTHDRHCEKALSMWLIVWGAFNLASSLLLITSSALPVAVLYAGASTRRSDCARSCASIAPATMAMSVMVMSVLFAIFGCFLFCWLIVGSVWVYPSSSSAHLDCDPSLYNFSFGLVTAAWVSAVPLLVIIIVVNVYAARASISSD
jgi:hypothetical protein